MNDKYRFYEVGDTEYKILESEASEFEKDFPSAKVNMSAGGENYLIGLNEREEFMSDFGNEVTYTDFDERPSWGESAAKGAGAGFTRSGKGLLDALQWLSAGTLYNDPETGAAKKTDDYDTQMRDEANAFRGASIMAGETADRLSREADPTGGEKGFVDLISEGKIGMALQKGLATGAESLPMTLSAYNPYTMALNMVSMAGANYAEQTLENPEVDKWKRATQAIGSAALEQAVEKFADPVFKYIGGGKGVKGITEDMAKEILEKGTKEAADGIAKRIWNVVKNTGKDALGEGAEEVITSFGNDALGQALDWIDGDKDYGITAQWEQMKEQNPDADLKDFAKAKAKEYMDSFIGGALSGAYMSGTTQAAAETARFVVDKTDSNELQQAYNDGATLDLPDMYDSDSLVNETRTAVEDSFVNENGESEITDEFISNLTAEDAFALSRNEELSSAQRGAMFSYAKAKAVQEGLNKKLDERLANEISAQNALIDGVTENGSVVYGTHNGRPVYVKGGVANNGNVTLSGGENGPVIIVDTITGQESTVRSEEIKYAESKSTDEYRVMVEEMLRGNDQKNREAFRNTMSVRAKTKAVQPFAGKKILVDVGNGITEVFVQEISPKGKVIIKGKKGDLGGQSILTLNAATFYDSIYRDDDGNPVVTEAGTQETEQEATEQNRGASDKEDFREGTYTILIDGKPVSVEVTAQDDTADRITYEYTDEDGNAKTGASTIDEFRSAIQPSVETPASPEPNVIAETPIPEYTGEPEPIALATAPEEVPITPDVIDWDALFEQDKEAYFTELQNQFGEETIDILNEEIEAAQSELDALAKAKTKSQNERLENRRKKGALLGRIEALNGMVARLNTVTEEVPSQPAQTETPVEVAPTEPVASAPQTPAETAPVESQPVPETQPEVPVEEAPVQPEPAPVNVTPVAPTPVDNPIAEAQKKERSLANQLQRYDISPEQKQDMAFSAGKAVGDFFATREEYEAYAENATDLGDYNADFERGIDASFANRQQNIGNSPVNSIPLGTEPNGVNNEAEGATSNEGIQGRRSIDGDRGTNNGRGEERVPQATEEQSLHEGEAGTDEALEDKYPARTGDVKPSDFVDVFGFKSVAPALPLHILNSTYDMLMETAKILGVSPKSITHGGTLELGVVPDRESDETSASYTANGRYGTPVTKAIMELRDGKNLSAIAHEWWHSLDHVLRYWNSGRGREYTSNATSENFDGRPEVLKAVKGVLTAIRKSGHVDRIKKLYFRKSYIDYLKSKKELSARAFEEYVIGKLAEAGIEIEGVQKDDWVAQPTAEEMAVIAPAFDNLFKVLKEKEGKKAGTSILYHIGEMMEEDSPAKRFATEAVLTALDDSGIDVVRATDEQTQQMLDVMEEVAEMQKGKAPETVSVQDEHHQTVVSSADGAKVLKDLDSAIDEYDSDTVTKEKTFLGNVAKALGAKKHGSRTEFYQTPNGTVYGWTDGKKIYLTEAGINPNTPIHEYTHLWAKAMMQKNPKGWSSIKKLLNGTPVWNDVMNDPNYINIHNDEDAVASEALSRISGAENAAKMEQMAQKMIDEAKGTARKLEARGLVQNMRDALNKFWEFVWKDLFKMGRFISVEHVTDRILFDLLNNTDLGELSEGQVETQIVTDSEVIESELRTIKENAQKNGTFMKAPNGQPTKLNERQWLQVRTKNFLNWFGDWINDPDNASKVVDENGEPLVVYHGSPYGNIMEFDRRGHSVSGLREFGTYFSTSKELAQLYAYARQQAKGDVEKYELEKARLDAIIFDNETPARVALDAFDELDRLEESQKPRIYEVFLNIRKPKVFDAERSNGWDGWHKLKQDVGYDVKSGVEAIEAISGHNRAARMNETYDGIIAKNMADVHSEATEDLMGDVFLVFDETPANIKSATDNVGTFDPLLTNIRYRSEEKNTNFVEQFEFKQNNERQELEYSDEFRRLQEESSRMSGQLVSEKDGVQQAAIRGLVGRIGGTLQRELDRATSGRGNKLRTVVNESKGTSFDIIENVDGRLFHDIFEIVRAYLPNGELVDLHDNYDDAICYITSDGLAGFAVSSDGNLISVYSLYGKSKKGFLGSIKDLITEAGATHLDGYNSPKQPLAKIYSKVFGWKVASMMDYNMEYDHDNIAENHEMPQVAFMVNTDADIETRHFDKDQYDDAVAYQLEQVAKSKENSLSSQNDGNTEDAYAANDGRGMPQEGTGVPREVSVSGPLGQEGRLYDPEGREVSQDAYARFNPIHEREGESDNRRNLREARFFASFEKLTSDEQLLLYNFLNKYLPKNSGVLRSRANSFVEELRSNGGTALADFVEDFINDELKYREGISTAAAAKHGLLVGISYDASRLEQIFDAYNNDKYNEALFDRAIKLAKRFGVTVKFATRNADGSFISEYGSYNPNDNSITLDANLLTDGNRAELCQTIVHELIHSVVARAASIMTGRAVDKNNQFIDPQSLPNDVVDGINTLKEVYEAIKADGTFQDTYGQKDFEEMLSEITDPKFRGLLKAKKLWKKFLNGICQILGIADESSTESDALTEIESALDKILSTAERGELDSAYASYLGQLAEGYTLADLQRLESGTVKTMLTQNILFRTGIDPTEVARETAKQVYDRQVSDNWQEFQRQFQDAYQPVRIAIDAIQQETGNIPIEDYENYLLIQNQSSSRSRVEIDNFGDRYYSPIIKQVNKIIDEILDARGLNKKDKSRRTEVYAELMRYLIAKHGLERNKYYQETKKRKLNKGEKERAIKEAKDVYDALIDSINTDTSLTDAERELALRNAKDEYDAALIEIDSREIPDLRDYSGLTALFGMEAEDFVAAEEEARVLVDRFENEVDTEKLWKKINAATDKTLRHSYESGLLSRQQYNDIKAMFKFYIPLRGFDETTAEDVYSYARFEGNRFNPAVQKAHGRTSIADDPIATIMNMAESEIAQGNKNRAKQALYNFLLNRAQGNAAQNSLMQIEDVWYVVSLDENGNEVHSIAAPDHENGETYEQFIERMNALAEEDKAYKSKKGQVDLGVRFQKQKNKGAHYVYLKVNGVEKAIYINGDPKAADAINGVYSPQYSDLMQKARNIQRIVSSTFTNYSLEFTARNFFRDMIYSHINIGVRESDPAYRKKFRQNWRHNNMGTMLMMLKAYRAGEYDGRPLNEDEAAFVEFMNNGGQTGYTLINSVEAHKKDLERAIKHMQNGINKGGIKDSTIFKYTLGGIELLNEASELVTRFAAFKTSRDMGREINRAISDAKEITVNFNTKGAQDGHGAFGMIARYLGSFKYFFNASVQGVQNLYNAFQTNKLKFGGVVCGTIGAGMMMPIIQGALSELFGGDEDEYWNIPDYERQNNLCFVIGDGKYVKIPLPIGFREMYGIGDMIIGAIQGKKFARSPLSVGMDMANKIATIVLPINPLEGAANGLSLIESATDALLPDLSQGYIQNRTNTDFKGAPLQKEYTYNEYDPQWTKAFSSNPAWLTGLSKWCYEHLVIDGKSFDWSPEKLDNTLSNTFGGIYALSKKASRTVSMIWNEDNRNLSNVPLAGVIIGSGIDKDERFVNSAYWEMDEYYNERIGLIKTTADTFGYSLDEVFARVDEDDRVGKHHPAMNKIYNRDNFDWMQEWYWGNKGEKDKYDENGEKVYGVAQLRRKIKDVERKIKKNENGEPTLEQAEELVYWNNKYETTRRDFVDDMLELD